MMTQDNFPKDSVRQAALVYCEKGFAPVPVPLRSKGPIIESWQDLRLRPDVLARYFPQDRASNIGLILHDGCRLIDLDLDCSEAVRIGNQWLPPTSWVSGRAGNPHSHFWYIASQVLDHIDFDDIDGARLMELRAGDGRQTVVPPSIHVDGDDIVWHSFHDLPSPIDAGDIVHCAGEVASLALLARHWPQTYGHRQSMYMALAGGLVLSGWETDKIERFIALLAELSEDEEIRKRVKVVVQTAAKVDDKQKVKGWPSLAKLLGQNGNAIVEKVRGWIKGLHRPTSKPDEPKAPKIRKLEAYQPFPVHLLPDPLDAFVEQGAIALGCDPTYVALPVLAAVGSCIGNTRAIRLKRGWEEPSIFWSVIVGDSGTTKTPAFKLAVRHLYGVQEALLLAFMKAMEEWEAAIESWEATDTEDRGERPEKPKQEKAICSDATIEKLAEILEDSPRGVLLGRDELAGWLGSFSRYKGKANGSDLPNWLEMSSAGTIIVDRKTGNRTAIFVRRAAVSITGSIQPGVLARALTQEFLDAGLAARLLMAMPPKLPKIWTEAAVDPATEERYHQLLDRLRSLEFDEDLERGRNPHVLSLAEDAKAIWVEYFNDWGREQSGVQGELAAAYSKLEAYSARFALLHHVATHIALGVDDCRLVGRKSIEAGIGLSKWFASEARRIYGSLAESEDEREIRRLVEFIRAHGGRITVRELMRSNTRRFPDSATAEAAMKLLVDAGLARWFDVPTKMRGGIPIKAIELVDEPKSDDPNSEDPDPSEPSDREDGVSSVGAVSVVTLSSNPKFSPQADSSRAEPESGVSAVRCHAQCKSKKTECAKVHQSPEHCHAEREKAAPAVMRPQDEPDGQSGSGPTTKCLGEPQQAEAIVLDNENRDSTGIAAFSSDFVNSVSGVMHETELNDDLVQVVPIEQSPSHLFEEFDRSSNPSFLPKYTCMTPDTADTDPQSKKPALGDAHDSVVTASGTAANALTGVGGVMQSLKMKVSEPFLLVSNPELLAMVVTAVNESTFVGLDCETTGLDPRTDRVRLLALDCDTNDGGRLTYIVDVSKVDPAPLWPVLAEIEVITHNGIFDLAFLGQLGFVPGRVHDTRLMSQVLYASAHTKGKMPTKHGLKDCCQRELGIEISKDLQNSNWSGNLTREQLEYSAYDAAVLLPLYRKLAERLQEAKLAEAASIEARALPCLVWLSNAGVPFARQSWRDLAKQADAETIRLRGELDAIAPVKTDGLYDGTWNWDSPEQVKQALKLAGCDVESTRDDLLATLDHPLAALLRDYREASKRKSTYGNAWLEHVADDGRIYPHWVQLGANSGRMACGRPNMQNLPRGPYRRSVAAPEGRVLVKADYSQIELRIAAKISGDKALLAAYQRGDDLHTLTARNVLGVPEVTKEARQLAKAVNFGLLYGMGSKTFQSYARTNYGVILTEAESNAYREAFFRTYPGLRRWHRSVGDRPIATRTLTNRRVIDVDRFTEKLNLPVQGSGADGLKLALVAIWERRLECPSAVPVLAVHDEIVLECPATDGPTVAEWLKRVMIEAMSPLVAPIPVEVEVKVARTWGGD